MTVVRTTLFIRLVTTLVVAIIVTLATDHDADRASAVELGGRTQCALRDLRILMLIESHGEADDISANRLSEASITMMKARAACAAGRVDEGLEIYDSIVVTLARAAGK